MKLKHLAISVAGLMVLGAGIAYAQFIPQLNLAAPNGTESFQVFNGAAGPQITSLYVRQARDAAGYIKSAASSGTVTFASGTSEIMLTDATTISTLTIALTAAPVDGQINCWYNKSAISTLTMSASGSQTINDGLSSTSATTRYCFLYSASNTSWDRLQ